MIAKMKVNKSDKQNLPHLSKKLEYDVLFVQEWLSKPDPKVLAFTGLCRKVRFM